MVARSQEEEGVESYEGVLRERAYLGFTGLTFRRERSLLQWERVARVRWSRTGGKTIEWIGSREEVPILGGRGWVQWRRASGEKEGSINIGLGPGREGLPDETKKRLQETVLADLQPMLLSYRPGDDRLIIGASFALHPLADSAAFHYRYRSGDTLRIDLPTENRTVTLAEVLVEPREARFDLLAGSFWFDKDPDPASGRQSPPERQSQDRCRGAGQDEETRHRCATGHEPAS
jgi:hypothetical protein